MWIMLVALSHIFESPRLGPVVSVERAYMTFTLRQTLNHYPRHGGGLTLRQDE